MKRKDGKVLYLYVNRIDRISAANATAKQSTDSFTNTMLRGLSILHLRIMNIEAAPIDEISFKYEERIKIEQSTSIIFFIDVSSEQPFLESSYLLDLWRRFSILHGSLNYIEH
jgi:aminoglycoside phosphotransferase